MLVQVALLAALSVSVRLVDGQVAGARPFQQSGTITLSYQDNAVLICSPDSRRCRRISYSYLKSKYPSYFMTAREYGQIYNLPYRSETCMNKRSDNATCPSPTSDDDRCCETRLFFEEAPVSVQVDNRPCYIIHFPYVDEYQFVPVGVCGATGSCIGKCIEESAMHPVVCVWKWFWPIIRIGYVNTTHYCSCKNVTPT